MSRFAVVRVPTTGPPALMGEPALFSDRDAAEARKAEIEARSDIAHHTWIDLVELGEAGARSPSAAFAAAGILR